MWIKWVQSVLPRRKVIYDQGFFRDEWFSGWKTLEPILCSLVSEFQSWRRILDFGCGPGAMIDPMIDRGFQYTGCDYSEDARNLYLSHFGKNPASFISSLEQADMKQFDLLLSFDVFEHMRDPEITQLLQTTRSIQNYFFNISRDLRTPGHINIKSDRGWLNFFKNQGLNFNEDATELLRHKYTILRPGSPDGWDKNMFVFRRNKLDR